MNPTATHISYFNICHRKLWLFHHQIQMEHHSSLVSEGRLIGETTYPQRPSKYTEVVIGPCKIDYYNIKSGEIHEVKKSDKMEEAHIMQVKYYLWTLEQHGMNAARGIIEYPKLRSKTEVLLTDDDRREFPKIIKSIADILAMDVCPDVIRAKVCKKCSYEDFCYAGENF